MVGAVGLVLAWVCLYSAVYAGVKHASRDLFEEDGSRDEDSGASP